MLDIVHKVTKHESEVVAVTQVVEKSVTPDKVAEIYKDSMAEAKSRIVSSITLDNSYLSAVVVTFQESLMDRVFHIHTRFYLNGVEKNRTVKIPRDSLSIHGEKESMVKAIHDHYTQEVSKILIEEAGKIIFHKHTNI